MLKVLYDQRIEVVVNIINNQIHGLLTKKKTLLGKYVNLQE